MFTAQGSLWAIHPKPFEGEVLSSWLTRVAHGNALTLPQFRKICLPKIPGSGADVDQILSPYFFTALAEGVGVPFDRAWCTGYASDEGRVFSRTVFNNLEWIAPLTVWVDRFRGKRQPSLSFCPACYAEDEISFYRKRWRYAFHPVCPKHGLLSSRCGHCAHPYTHLDPLSRSAVSFSLDMIGLCPSCQRPYQPMKVPGLDDKALAATVLWQDRIMAAVESGWIEVDGQGPVHVCMYLRGLHELAIMPLHWKHGPSVIQWISRQAEFSIPKWENGVNSQSMESLPAHIRAWLLLMATWLAGEWPLRLVSMLNALNLKHFIALSTTRKWPAWMSHSTLDAMSGARFGRSAREIEEARGVLARRMRFAPSEADLLRFMKNGEVSPVRPLSSPVHSDLKEMIRADDMRVNAIWEARAKEMQGRRERPRELYLPPVDLRQDEMLADLDDSSERLNELARVKRKSRAKPTS